MKILVIDNAEPEDKNFNAPLLQCLSRFTAVESVNYRDIPPSEILTARYNGIVLSGAPVHYDFDIIDSRLTYIAWAKTIQIPILGVCLGHQNLGRMYGSGLIMNDEAEDGMEPLEIKADSPLFEGIKPGDKVAAHHRGSITLPDDFILLASTPHCHNQAMKHKEKNIYSVQFHAELSDAGIKILGNFINIIHSN